MFEGLSANAGSLFVFARGGKPAMHDLIIFDTTLRDGEQSPGAAMTAADRLQIARELESAGVGVIEAGFPASSPAVEESIAEIARNVTACAVAALARALPSDIDCAWRSICRARRPRIHTFIATSRLHMERKLRMSPEAVIAAAAEAVRYARRYTADVEFSAEDATRSDPEFLARVLSAAIDAGAAVVNVPDTVGYMLPDEYAALLRTLLRTVRGIDRVVLSAHCHDDLGLAAANTLAAIVAGARQVEVTVNGIGERAGNCALEEVVTALRVRPEPFPTRTGFDTTRLPALSALVARATRMPVQKNKAVVGENAFAHEAGIHQDGVLKDRSTYEIIDAGLVGRAGGVLHLGRQSGRHALRSRLRCLGYAIDEAALERAYGTFLRRASAIARVDDDDLHAIARACLEVPA